MTSTVKPLAYSIKEAASVSSIGRTRLYELINEGKLDRIKIGNRSLIKADSLCRLLEIDT